jgi:hypothetical protein
VSAVYDKGTLSLVLVKIDSSPVYPALDGATAVDSGAGVGDGAPHAGDGGVKRIVKLAVELDLDDLAALKYQ